MSRTPYATLFLGQTAVYGAKQLWKVRAPAKCGVFVWLALQDKCWTAERRQRHRLQNDNSCALCLQQTLRLQKGIFFGESSFASAKDIRKVKQTDCLSRFAFSFLLFLLVFEKSKN
jgi:hypothetical protein